MHTTNECSNRAETAVIANFNTLFMFEEPYIISKKEKGYDHCVKIPPSYFQAHSISDVLSDHCQLFFIRFH